MITIKRKPARPEFSVTSGGVLSTSPATPELHIVVRDGKRVDAFLNKKHAERLARALRKAEAARA